MPTLEMESSTMEIRSKEDSGDGNEKASAFQWVRQGEDPETSFGEQGADIGYLRRVESSVSGVLPMAGGVFRGRPCGIRKVEKGVAAAKDHGIAGEAELQGWSDRGVGGELCGRKKRNGET